MKVPTGFGPVIAALVLMGCTATAWRQDVSIGGQTVNLVMQNCKPGVKWDGINVVLEGLKLPDAKDLKFSVGKLNFTEKAIREIRSTVFYYDGLLNATCQTLVRLNSQEAIERYSKHRDTLLVGLVNTLAAIENADSDTATALAAKAKEKAEQSDAELRQAKK